MKQINKIKTVLQLRRGKRFFFILESVRTTDASTALKRKRKRFELALMLKLVLV